MGTKIEATSLVEAVTERLEAAIISGELVPGTRLSEQVLAKEYGISRGPLREAIRRLEGRRLLERKANIGVSVVELSLRRLDELLKVREALEGMACRLAAERIGQEEVEQIRKLLDEHALRDEALSGEGYYQQSGDFDFHFRIAKASGNDYLMEMISGDLYDLLRIYRYKSSTMPAAPCMRCASTLPSSTRWKPATRMPPRPRCAPTSPTPASTPSSPWRPPRRKKPR